MQSNFFRIFAESFRIYRKKTQELSLSLNPLSFSFLSRAHWSMHKLHFKQCYIYTVDRIRTGLAYRPHSFGLWRWKLTWLWNKNVTEIGCSNISALHSGSEVEFRSIYLSCRFFEREYNGHGKSRIGQFPRICSARKTTISICFWPASQSLFDQHLRHSTTISISFPKTRRIFANPIQGHGEEKYGGEKTEHVGTRGAQAAAIWLNRRLRWNNAYFHHLKINRSSKQKRTVQTHKTGYNDTE